MAQINVNDLLAERAKLLERLAEINAALETLKGSAARAVRIATPKNIRNTRGLTTNPKYVGDGTVLVFADENLTQSADSANHNGYVSAADWAWIEANPDEVGEVDLAGDY